MIVMAIVNQKGGVGKTTTTINLAAALAEQNQRVLVVDLDPQRNATTSLHSGSQFAGYDVNDLIYHAVCRHPYEIGTYIHVNEDEKVSYIPATPMLASAPNILAQDKDSMGVLRRIICDSNLDASYNFILIDCKPSMDLLVNNALLTADRVIVPLMPEDYALDGLTDLMETITGIQARYNPNLKVDGILITRANMQRKVTKELIADLRDAFGELVYDTIIPDRADCAKAQRAGRSMVQMAGNALGHKYMELAKEVLNHE